jgi:uncharacterized phage protein (TIGR01671 family)
MNRTIKFRGKRADNGEWVFGNYFRLVHHGIMRHLILPSNSMSFDDELIKNILIDVIPETVGQFTGLLDRDGKEIYEGDILKYTFDYYDENTVAKLEFSIQDGAWVLSNNKFNIDETFTCESAENAFIIGNIYDNKELLKD